MEDERRDRRYRPGSRLWVPDQAPERVRSLADWVERILLQLVILGLVALVLVQALWTQPTLRKWAVLADQLEGVNWGELLPRRSADLSPPASGNAAALAAGAANGPARAVTGRVPTGQVTVMLMSRRSAPGVKLLVDGLPVAEFSRGAASVKVLPGQQLAVDGRAEPTTLTFRVVATSDLQEPALGTQVITFGDLRPLGTARTR